MRWFCIFAWGLVGAASADEFVPGLELVYSGRLASSDEKGPATSFSYHAFVLSAADERTSLAWMLEERNSNGWQWPERFGEFGVRTKTTQPTDRSPALLYEYDGADYVVALPAPLFAYREQLRAEAQFREGQADYAVTGDGRVADRDCWRIDATLPRGRKQTLAVEKSSGLVVSLQERLVLGRGVPFDLQIELQSPKKHADDETTQWAKAWSQLSGLQTALARAADRPRAELTPEQVKIAQAAAKALPDALAGTPWAKLSGVIARDLQQESRRHVGVAELEKKFVSKELPELTIKNLNNMEISSQNWQGHIVVLHFWEYPGDKMTEPYGQVGYLDFLNDKRKKLGVKVIGVAVDERFSDPAQKSAALRSVRKLQQFMNLGYDLALDDGSAIAELGDPRKLNAKLPLWIVVGADGKIAHYKAGLYDMQPDEGLRLLDEAVLEAVKNRPR